MRRIALFLLLGTSFVALAFNSYSQSTDSTLARKFIALNETGSFQEARQMFSPDLQSQLSSGLLENAWKSLIQKYGKFNGVSAIRQMNQDTFHVILPVCDFEKAEITLTLAFNPAHLLYGYRVADVKEKKEKTHNIPPHVISKDITIAVNGGYIAGTLTRPEIKEPVPVALIIAGSGPTDLNGNSSLGEQSNAYLMLADSLAVHGIASLRYDKRGVGKSNDFHQAESQLRFEDYVSDAVALIQYLKKEPGFSGIIVIGHSEGSLIGMLTAERTKPDAYISLAGAGEPIGSILQWQLSQNTQINQDKIKQIVDSLEAGHTVKEVPPSFLALFRPSVQPYLISWMKYDPAKEIRKLHIPVLLVNGTTDLQVAIKEAEMLHKAKPDAQLAIIPGMNHLLKNAPEDRDKNRATYQNPDLPLNNALIKKIVQFIRSVP